MKRKFPTLFTSTQSTPIKNSSYVVFTSLIGPDDAKEILRQELIQLADSNKLKDTRRSSIWLLRDSGQPCTLIITWVEYNYDLNNPKNINLPSYEKNTHKELIFTDKGWQINENGMEKNVVYTLNHSSQSEVNDYNALIYIFEQAESLGLSKSLHVQPHPDLASRDYLGYCIDSEDDTLNIVDNNKNDKESEKTPINPLAELKQILSCPYSSSLLENAHTIIITQYNKESLLAIQNALTDDLKMFKHVMDQLINHHNITVFQITINLDVTSQQLTTFNTIANNIIKIIPNFLVQDLAKIIVNEKLSDEDKINKLTKKLVCPITFEKLQSPCLLPGGKTCEEIIIKEIKSKNDADPMSNIPLTDNNWRPNRIISQFLETFSKLINENENDNANETTLKKANSS